MKVYSVTFIILFYQDIRQHLLMMLIVKGIFETSYSIYQIQTTEVHRHKTFQCDDILHPPTFSNFFPPFIFLRSFRCFSSCFHKTAVPCPCTSFCIPHQSDLSHFQTSSSNNKTLLDLPVLSLLSDQRRNLKSIEKAKKPCTPDPASHNIIRQNVWYVNLHRGGN